MHLEVFSSKIFLKDLQTRSPFEDWALPPALFSAYLIQSLPDYNGKNFPLRQSQLVLELILQVR